LEESENTEFSFRSCLLKILEENGLVAGLLKIEEVCVFCCFR